MGYKVGKILSIPLLGPLARKSRETKYGQRKGIKPKGRIDVTKGGK